MTLAHGKSTAAQTAEIFLQSAIDLDCVMLNNKVLNGFHKYEGSSISIF